MRDWREGCETGAAADRMCTIRGVARIPPVIYRTRWAPPTAARDVLHQHARARGGIAPTRAIPAPRIRTARARAPSLRRHARGGLRARAETTRRPVAAHARAAFGVRRRAARPGRPFGAPARPVAARAARGCCFAAAVGGAAALRRGGRRTWWLPAARGRIGPCGCGQDRRMRASGADAEGVAGRRGRAPARAASVCVRPMAGWKMQHSTNKAV